MFKRLLKRTPGANMLWESMSGSRTQMGGLLVPLRFCLQEWRWEISYSLCPNLKGWRITCSMWNPGLFSEGAVP
jgi:hypothetical protein